MKQGERSDWKRYLLTFVIFSTISIIIQSPQFYAKGFVLGVDSVFHMNRIYETMMQMKTGNFNYFISLFSFQQSARIVNAFYGPGMAYILGGILLLAGSWVKFQLITSFLVNVIGAFGVYRIAKKMDAKESLATFSGIIYMTAYSVSSWNIAGSFTGVGNMILPYVIYYGVEMMVDKRNNFSIVGLGLSMGILLQTHIFSSLLATITLLPFVLYAFMKTTNKRKFILNLFLAIVIAVLLSLNVWLGMLHVMAGNQLLQTVPMELFLNSVYFSSEKNDSQVDLGIILSILFLFQIFQSMVVWKQLNHLAKTVIVIGSTFLFFSSRFFPWGIFSEVMPELESYLQFPSRLVIVPTILLIASLGLTTKYTNQRSVVILIGICTVVSVSVAQNRVFNRMNEWNSENVLASPNKKPKNISDTELREVIRSQNLGAVLTVVQKGTSDYLPIEKDVKNDDFEKFASYSKYWKYVIRLEDEFEKKVENGQLIISWESTAGEVKIPIFKYADTTIKNSDAEEMSDINTTDIGTIIVQAVEGENKLIVSYPMPKIILFSIILVGVSFIILFSYQAVKEVRSFII